MKDEVKAKLVDSFAPAQSPLPLQLCRLLRGFPACGVLASVPARESFRVADLILVRPAEHRDRVFASINKEIP